MTEIFMETQGSEECPQIVSAAVEAALAHRGRSGEITVTLVDDEAIHEINRSYRNVDRPTDVISFPSEEGECIAAIPDGFLGDIIISLPRAAAQAEEYGHSFRRELSFLAVHGTLHLLGYDHMTDDEAKEMFGLQEDILREMGIER
ncbi:MAG: rRNA maturation RNase YbeY [Clostridia bacterium]|nr:rRNA maturation RNase YbeY [Clostridia bacterium]MBQ4611425.1 rRNA maturation RNase YbeY [Clostridia bacterium]MBQ6704245.1 rRNA maturation RNase YbeY [Clostridia bacterium]